MHNMSKIKMRVTDFQESIGLKNSLLANLLKTQTFLVPRMILCFLSWEIFINIYYYDDNIDIRNIYYTNNWFIIN